MQNSYNKYGKDCFAFATIEYCNKTELIEKEQYYLDYYKSIGEVYNIADYVERPTGDKLTEEHKHKLSLAKIGTHRSEETKRKIGEHSKGKKYALGNILSEETRKKMSAAKKGISRPQTDETKEKLRQINLGKKASESTRLKMSMAQKGKIISQETKMKISISKTGKHTMTDKMKEILRIARHNKMLLRRV